MSHRFNRVGAILALSLLTATQSFAATLGPTVGSIVYTPKYPQLKISCYTRVFFTSTNSQLLSRQCDAGEKPGSVKVIYVG